MDTLLDLWGDYGDVKDALDALEKAAIEAAGETEELVCSPEGECLGTRGLGDGWPAMNALAEAVVKAREILAAAWTPEIVKATEDAWAEHDDMSDRADAASY
jgi:hypothetical protein